MREGDCENRERIVWWVKENLYFCYVLREMWVKEYGKVVQVIGN